MATLTAGQLAALKKANIAPIAITAYQKGTAAPGVKKQIESVLQNSNRNNVGWATNWNPILPNSGSGLGGTPATTGGGRVNIPPARTPTGSPWGTKEDYSIDRRGTKSKPAPVPTAAPTPTGTTPFDYPIEDNPYGIPSAPDPYQFQVPVYEMRDFTEQARKIAADAFGPYLAGFDIARANAERQGNVSKEGTKKLYEQFGKDLASKAQETAQRYDAMKAEVAARGQANKADLQESAQSADTQNMDRMAALGIGSVAPDMNAQNAEANQANASQATGQTESMMQYLDKNQLGAGDYDTRFQNITQQSGINAQGQLDNSIMNLLANIDVNKANASGQVAQTAIDLAEKLANRDLQVQQLQGAGSMWGQQQQAGQQQQGFENQLGLHNTWEQQNQNNLENAIKIWATQAGFDLDWAKLNQAGGATPPDMSSYPGPARVQGYVATHYNADVANEVVSNLGRSLATYRQQMEQNPNPSESIQSRAQKFATWMSQQGTSSGVDPATLYLAAQMFYQDSNS